MKRLEGVRLEVDSRQRTVSSLTTTLNKQRATLPPNNTQMRTKGEVGVDSTIRKLTNKDNKLAGKTAYLSHTQVLLLNLNASFTEVSLRGQHVYLTILAAM